MTRREPGMSRRALLKEAVLGVGAAALCGPDRVALSAAKDKLRLAVVGCGGQGRGDMQGMLSTGLVKLVALCDPDAAQIEQARMAAGTHAGSAPKAYEDYRRLLDDAATIDAVLIATPDHWHAPLCKAFMKAGKHIYCEKPLTHSVAEARELREMSRRTNVVTQMGNRSE